MPPILFILDLEPLVTTIHANPSIKGIEFASTQHKLMFNPQLCQQVRENYHFIRPSSLPYFGVNITHFYDSLFWANYPPLFKDFSNSLLVGGPTFFIGLAGYVLLNCHTFPKYYIFFVSCWYPSHLKFFLYPADTHPILYFFQRIEESLGIYLGPTKTSAHCPYLIEAQNAWGGGAQCPQFREILHCRLDSSISYPPHLFRASFFGWV